MFCDICQQPIDGLPGRISDRTYHHAAGALASCYLRALTLRYGT